MISYKEYLRQYGKDNIVEDVFVYDQAFRRYTEKLHTWLKEKNLRVMRDDKTIIAQILYAYPSLPHAFKGDPNHLPHGQYQKELKDGIVALREERSPIPIISFYLSDIAFAFNRQVSGDVRYGNAPINGARFHALRYQKERPYDLTYAMSIWTKYKADMNHMWQQILHDFDPVLCFDVDNQQIPVRIINISDNSTLDSTGGSEQLVRWDVTVMLEGWLKTSVAKVPVIHKEKMQMVERTAVSMTELMNIQREYNLMSGEVDVESVD
jgi:hypothetical protein